MDPTTASKNFDYDAIVVGAGFGGIRSLWEMQKIGLSAKCFEAGSDVGGTWYWNRYPGARTDSEAWVYMLNFTPDLKDQWSFKERYPSQEQVQRNLSEVVDRFDLRKDIAFNTRIGSAKYDDRDCLWTITTTSGQASTCRYFLPATGPLSVGRPPPFAGLKSFRGEWYQASQWPKRSVDFKGKRVAIIGTGATGVQIIPKIAPVAKQLTVFQRTPNYVLPGRNHTLDEHQVAEIRNNNRASWEHASNHPFGLHMTGSGNNAKDITDAATIRQILDRGWESGGFHFQFETFDDLFTEAESNEIASEYLRNKIRAVVRDQRTAEILCPKYPFLSKRPPCGHYYYETYNRPNVKLVDISQDEIDLYEDGVKCSSGSQHEFDLIIFALGFDAATGALTEMDVRGSQGKSLKEHWAKRLETFAGVLVPGFPNMFMVCGPHVPFGNMPVVEEIEVDWIGKTLDHMEKNNLTSANAPEALADAWSQHVDEVFNLTLFPKSAKAVHAWFVGANIPGKANNVLFYFGGVPTWASWLNKERETNWAGLQFGSGQSVEDKNPWKEDRATTRIASTA